MHRVEYKIGIFLVFVLCSVYAHAQITGEDKGLHLNDSKTEGTASITVPQVSWAPKDDNPRCLTDEHFAGSLPIDTNVSRCRRLCGRIPEPYTLDQTKKISGSFDRSGWNSVFNPEWFANTNTACLHFKNWSDSRDITGTIHVPIRHR